MYALLKKLDNYGKKKFSQRVIVRKVFNSKRIGREIIKAGVVTNKKNVSRVLKNFEHLKRNLTLKHRPFLINLLSQFQDWEGHNRIYLCVSVYFLIYIYTSYIQSLPLNQLLFISVEGSKLSTKSLSNTQI